MEFKQELEEELNHNDTLRILGIIESNGAVLSKVYDFKIDNGIAVKLDTLPECLPSASTDCEASVTIADAVNVSGIGELIYEDQFDTLDMSKYRKEVRVRWKASNRELVAFMDDSTTCYIENGHLNLTAIVHYKTSFDLKGKCTAKYKRECKPGKRTAAFGPPPVYSAYLSSTFTFKYGRVDINASLPLGDYLFPCKYNVGFLF